MTSRPRQLRMHTRAKPAAVQCSQSNQLIPPASVPRRESSTRSLWHETTKLAAFRRLSDEKEGWRWRRVDIAVKCSLQGILGNVPLTGDPSWSYGATWLRKDPLKPGKVAHSKMTSGERIGAKSDDFSEAFWTFLHSKKVTKFLFKG